MQHLGATSKTTEWSQFVSKGNTTVIQVYAPTIHTEEAEVDQLYEDLEDLIELRANIYIYIFYPSLGIRMESWKPRDT